MFDGSNLKDLLLADLAVEEGLARAEDVADLLARRWSDGAGSASSTPLRDALVAQADLAPRDVLRLVARAERLIEEAAGSPGAAWARRSAGPGSLRASLTQRAAGAAAAPAAGGTPAFAELPLMAAGRYRDWTPLGEGGMGVVYRAHDGQLDRPVALKVARKEIVGPEAPSPTLAEEVLARFLREARLTGRLEHPGIVPVHEVGRTSEGLPYYSMRLVRDSRTLAEAIEQCWDAPQRLLLLEAFLKVCDAVAYAHGRGVIHRDLKPQNVVVGRYGEVVVLDWGLAKELGPPAAQGEAGTPPDAPARATGAPSAAPEDPVVAGEFRTQAGILGTVGYLAPEGLSGDAGSYGLRSDVFSLGVILFQILTGRLPWPEAQLPRYAAALQQDAPLASSIDPAAPEGLAAIAARALARESGARFADAGGLAQALRAWQSASALEREREGRGREAAAALLEAETLSGDAALRRLEHVQTLLGLLAQHHPDGRAPGDLAERVERLRSRALAERERTARRRALRWAAAVALCALALGALAFAWVVRDKNMELEASVQKEQAARQRWIDVNNTVLVRLSRKALALGQLDLLDELVAVSMAKNPPVGPDSSVDERALASMTLVVAAQSHEERGRVVEALAAYDKATEIRRELLAADPSSPAWRAKLGVAVTGRGSQLLALGRLREAQAALEEARALRAPPEGAAPSIDAIDAMLNVDYRLMLIAARRRDFAAARSAFDRAQRTVEERARFEPDTPDTRRARAILLMDMGELGPAGPSADERALALERSVALLEANVHDAPENADDAFLLAQALDLRHEAQPPERAGQPEHSDGARALDTFEKLFDRGPTHQEWARTLGLAYQRRASRRLRAGRPAEALEFSEKAERVWRPSAQAPTAGSKAWNDMADLDHGRVGALLATDQLGAALVAAERGVAARRRAVALAGEDCGPSLGLARDLCQEADLLLAHVEEDARALAAAEEAHRLLERLHAADPTLPLPDDAAGALLRCARILTGGGPAPSAEDHLRIAGWMEGRKRWATAAEHTQRALDDPGVRGDLVRAARWHFVRRAARASQEVASGAEGLRTAALDVLREDVEARRARLRAIEGERARAIPVERREPLDEERAALEASLEAARAGSTDIASLRGDPRFSTLFPP